MKNVWIVICSSGIGGAERRALKLAIYLAESGEFKVHVLINAEMLKYLKNDVQINEAIEREDFKVEIAEDYYRKIINYKHFFGIIKRIHGLHHVLKNVPFLYRYLLKYFSYQKVFKRINFKQDDVIHSFSTDAVRLGLMFYKSDHLRNIVVELVGNKFLQRYATQIALAKYNPKNTHFKAVSKTVLHNFKQHLKDVGVENLQNVTEWDGPFIYVPKTKDTIDKKNVIVFASRFNQPKNPILFSKAIKNIFDKKELADWKVIIRGRGALETEIREILKVYIDQDRVDVGFSGELYKDLQTAKVFVSIIVTGNYPSQSLFEAMSYGAIPIISKTGNSEEKYNDPNVVFCELDLEDLEDKLARTCKSVQENEESFIGKSNSIKKYSDALIHNSNYVKELKAIYEG